MTRALETIIHEIRESLAMALTSVRTNRLRSILTLLGIAVGVFSIIAVMTAMGVLVNSIEKGMSQLGVNTFQVQKTPMFRTNNPRERRKIRNRRPIRFPQGSQVKERTSLSKAVGLEA
ncbi:MAG TPA: ABC transporter permease, partial [Bacteroidota bacterium]|nr:ABC transporter permease [Bacteroidota bacterium]